MSDPLFNVDILIKTFLRPNCLQRLVDSILSRYPNAHLNIADDGEPDESMRRYYKDLEARGHQIRLLPFNVGISSGRNSLVEASTRPYLLLLDDDVVFTNQTRIETLTEVLEADQSLGVAGGSLLDRGTELRSYEFVMRIEDRLLHYYPIRRETRLIAGHACFDTEIVLNFCLFRREVLSTTRWDDSLKTNEHTDFFLRLAKTPWKVVHVPSVIADHHAESTAVYQNYRMNSESEKHFNRKWKTGGFVYHQSHEETPRERWRVRRAYARAAVRSLRERHVGQAGGLLTGAAIAEVRRARRYAQARTSARL
jgi:GT2 family glycosyltransferase